MKFLISLIFAIAASFVACAAAANSAATGQPRGTLSIDDARAYYEEKCRTVAGEKIYKKVENVEGIVLLKVRPKAGEREWANRMWPGAAFALESRTDEYITTFLGYEHSSSAIGKPITPQYRGYISPNYEADNPNNNPGYRYVDVIDEKDGKRYRYVLVPKPRPTSQIGWVDIVLDKKPAPDPSPRYGVTFEDHVIPEERAVWVASSTVKVVDLKTNEVLGEMIRYAWAGGGPTPSSPSPWLRARKCPGHPVGAEAATRKFVDQILIPKKEQ